MSISALLASSVNNQYHLHTMSTSSLHFFPFAFPAYNFLFRSFSFCFIFSFILCLTMKQKCAFQHWFAGLGLRTRGRPRTQLQLFTTGWGTLNPSRCQTLPMWSATPDVDLVTCNCLTSPCPFGSIAGTSAGCYCVSLFPWRRHFLCVSRGEAARSWRRREGARPSPADAVHRRPASVHIYRGLTALQ